MRKYVLSLFSLLFVALTPITAFAASGQGEFLIQPKDTSAFNNEDVYMCVSNDSYEEGTEVFTRNDYKVYEVQDDGFGGEILIEKPSETSLYVGHSVPEDPAKYLVKIGYLPTYESKAVIFRIGAEFSQTSNPTITREVMSDDFKVTWSAKKKLVSIVDPADITGLPHGTEKTAAALGLPEKVVINLDDLSTREVDVAWNVSSSLYVVTNLNEQTFTVSGTITLPEDVDQDSKPLATKVKVTVNRAPSVAKPTVTPAPGTFYTSKDVSLSCSTSGAVIYYTTDGTDPTTSSTEYTAPFTLTADPKEEEIKNYTVKAIAVKDGMNDSDVCVATYTIAPPPKYTVTVNNDGNGTANADVTSAKEGVQVTLTATPNTGYKFKQWTSSGTAVSISDNKFNMPAGNVTLKAEFEVATQYTVTFYTQYGPSIASQKVYDGQKATKPSTPTASGYTFGGFYKDATFSQEFDFNQAITANTSVYLKWTKTEYFTVSFAMGGHGSSIAPVKVEKGKKLSKPSDPYASGFTFEGWYKDSGHNDKYDFDESVTRSFTLYAKWTNNNGNNNNSRNSGYQPYNSSTRSTSLSNMYAGGLKTGLALPNPYTQLTQPFVYQQVLPEGSVMCSLGGKEPILDMKAYGTDPKNIINQQLLASTFMNTLYNMDAACYKTVDLYPTVSVKGGPNDGSFQILRWVGTNYPAGAVFGVVWNYWDKAYIIPGVCDVNGTVTLTNFKLRPESTLTLVVPMQRVSTETATKSSNADPNGVTKVETVTTTTTTTEETSPATSTPAKTSSTPSTYSTTSTTVKSSN